MGDLQLDNLIAVRVFQNGTEQKEFAYVEQGNVAKAKQTLDEDFKAEGSFRRGPLRLHPDRALELGCIYSYYFTDTGQGSQPSSSSQRTRDPGLKELWKQLSKAKETNGFLELPESISKIFPKAGSGKLLVRAAYKTLLRVLERRSRVTLVPPEYYASIDRQSEETSPSPVKKQKTESAVEQSLDTQMAEDKPLEFFDLFSETNDEAKEAEERARRLATHRATLPKGYIGTPGTGKTMLLPYLLHFLAAKAATVVLSSTECVEKFLFSSGGCFWADSLTAFRDELDKKETFLLVDSHVPPIKNAMTIMVSSPRKSVVQVYVKDAKDYYMPLWEPAEVSKLWNANYRDSRDHDQVKELFSQWGGCVRWILEKPYEDSKNKLQEAVDSSTGENLLAACRSKIDDKISNRIVHHIPSKELDSVETVTLASSHVASMVYQKLKKASVQHIVWFLESSATHKNCSTIRGILFEEFVVDHQALGGDVCYKCKSHSEEKGVPGADLESVTFNAGEVKRFNKSKEIVAEPSNAIWWPTKSNHEAVDFYRQPNELCQVTVNENHDKLNMTTILKEFERLSAFEDDGQTLIFSYIVPVDIYDKVHKIPGIEIPSKPQSPRTEAQRKKQALMSRIEWRILKLPFISGSGVEQAFSGLKI